MQKLLIEFFKARPAVNKSGFAKEAGISGSYLQYLIKGEYNPTTATINRIKATMNRYGYSPEN